MLNMIQSWFTFLEPFWPYIAAVALPLIASWGATQVAKYIWRVCKTILKITPNEALEKLMLRALAVAVCFFGAYQLWPADFAAWFALAIAPWSPLLYGVTVEALYHKWPKLEDWLSASPNVQLRRDEDGNVIGYKEGDDPTVLLDRTERPDDE